MAETKQKTRAQRKPRARKVDAGAELDAVQKQAFDDAAQATAETVTVTPQMALKWLQDDPRPNRIVRQVDVNKFAREMITGRWRFNGEPIRFNTLGRLIDGQHRLWAIVESEVSLPMSVVRNLQDDTIFVTDIGRGRNLAQFLSLMEQKDTGVLAAAVTCHHRWLSTATYNALAPNLTPTIQDLLTVYQDHGDVLKASLKAVRAVRAKRLGSAGLWGSIMVPLNALSEEDAADFFKRYVTLASMEQDHPVMRLRARLEAARTPRGGMSMFDLAPLIIKAWNHYRKGEKVAQLRYRGGGAQPETYPVPI